MINQLKIQLNLYSHREKDNYIIESLGLDSSDNPNNKVREILYNISKGNEHLNKNNANDFKKELDSLHEKIKRLEAENSLLKGILNKNTDTTNISSGHKEEEKINNKLMASVKQLEI